MVPKPSFFSRLFHRTKPKNHHHKHHTPKNSSKISSKPVSHKNNHSLNNHSLNNHSVNNHSKSLLSHKKDHHKNILMKNKKMNHHKKNHKITSPLTSPLTSQKVEPLELIIPVPELKQVPQTTVAERKTAEKRTKLLKDLTKKKKKYINHISKKQKKIIHQELKKQRHQVKKYLQKVGDKKELRNNQELRKNQLHNKLLSKKSNDSLLKKDSKLKSTSPSTSPSKNKKLPKIKEEKSNKSSFIDFSAIKQQLKGTLIGTAGEKTDGELLSNGKNTGFNLSEKEKETIRSKAKQNFKGVYTGISGFDVLLEEGIPEGSSILVAGGAGSGKTIFCLQTLFYHASHGKKCLYMSFEETEARLINHMAEFGWDAKKLIKKGNLMIKTFNPFEITRSVDALLMKAKGELLIDVDPIILPKKFMPDFIVVDSLSAIASAFTGKEDSYRIYIEQLFRFFESMKATSFMITETEQVPKIFSATGVEEFLADGVIVIYNIRRDNIRERAIEILKLRGAGHKHKLVAMDINKDGLEVYPEQEIFGGLGEEK